MGQLALPGFSEAEGSSFDPIQTTFRGGLAEPLHDWYPWLEGYSPKFVEAILGRFAPAARVVFDPFGGTGTTALAVMNKGLRAYYAEINPLLQFLVETKVAVHELTAGQRGDLVLGVKGLLGKLTGLLRTGIPDRELDVSYGAVFGSSVFFDEATFALILRSRTAVDRLAIENALLAKLLTVAIVASLIPSSAMIRRGDVRYRNERELLRRVAFEDNVREKLCRIVEDLEKIETPQNGSPIFLCEDARTLRRLPPHEFDTVITSPPYLNGTNYFRNTKLELWFLRCLLTKADLAAFRLKAVTSGINDVTVDKTNGQPHPAVRDLVGELETKAYDSRIPRMISGYFSDMCRVFEGLQRHLCSDAVVAVDIGDSVYGGVHIPTDNVLVAILQGLGYRLEDQVTLRRRLSRDRTPLRQVLLVFKGPSTASGSQGLAEEPYSWEGKWHTLKRTLPYKEIPYSQRNWGHPLHSLCSYHGKLKPSIAHFLVSTFAPRGGSILDPFAGVGTIPFEAALQGVRAWGFDISPAARFIAKGKVEHVQQAECEQLLQLLGEFLHHNEPSSEEYDSAQSVRFNGSIPEYYHPDTLREILLARRYFMQHPPEGGSASLVFASLLHILHGNRPYALSRRSHPITPLKPTGPFEYRGLLRHLREKVYRSINTLKPDEFVEGKIFNQDATSWWPQEVRSIDAIITSPPFFDSTRFHVGNWLRLWFCGWERRDFNEKPLAFVDERQKRSLQIYEPIFRQARERLRPNGAFVLHLGQSVKCNMAHELGIIAKEWFRVTDLFSEDVTSLEKHGIRDKGTVTAHQFLILS